MDKNRFLFSSESVTEGHPDKICDHIADKVLDAALAADPESRIACEVCCTTGLVLVMGEFTTESYIDIPKIVRETVKDIGYTDAAYGFDYKTCAVITSIDEQSPDIAMGVNKALEAREGNNDAQFDTGAGDQGMMFGYACDETPECMPMPISYAHKLAKRLTAARREGALGFLRPDGKTQVTVRYENGRPVCIDSIVVSSQHDEDVSLSAIREGIMEEVIYKTVPRELLAPDVSVYINPTGRFVIGGPHGDSGVTGRKIIVDTYGGSGRHGGGSFSGKDPTKVDRSAAYAARRVAKTIVRAGLAARCEVQLAYAIGVSNPVSIMVDTFGTGTVADEKITAAVRRCFDLRPAAIIEDLQLRRPIYTPLAAYGHMGREELGVLWEDDSYVPALLDALR